MFGISGGINLIHQQNLIANVFKCAIGKYIPIWDMFCLGKKKPDGPTSQPRPMLVKLQCAWNRIILAGILHISIQSLLILTRALTSDKSLDFALPIKDVTISVGSAAKMKLLYGW